MERPKNVSPVVWEALRSRSGVGKSPTFIPPAVPSAPSEVDPTVGDEVPVEEVVEEVVPENDNPPKPPANGEYAYQTRVVITPARAQQLIDLNAANNRKRKESKVTRLARDMSKNLWVDKTGETVKISESGFMIDGQNRMYAVIRSRRTIVVDIAWNVPDDRMGVLDDVTPRNTSDDFKIMGVSDPYKVGPLVRWVLAWEKGNYLNHGGRLTPTRSEIRERYLKEPTSFDTAAMFGRAAHHQIGAVNATSAAMAYWLFAKMDNNGSEQAEQFFSSFIGGLELTGGSPVTVLRNRFTASRGRDFNRNEQLVLMIKAWNSFRSGRPGSTSGRVMVSRDRLTNENFPMPQ